MSATVVETRTACLEDGDGAGGGFVNALPVRFERVPAGLPEGMGAR